MTTVATGFAPFTSEFNLSREEAKHTNVVLKIATQHTEVAADDSSSEQGISAATIVIGRRGLQAFSDDPTELEAQLRELSGPVAGPNGGQIYIDGFQGGVLPPKDAIREVRVNENPFSAQYEELGFGRIDVFTRPGSDRWRGQLSVIGNTSQLNAGDPFASTKAPSDAELYSGTVGGPLTRNASARLSFDQRDLHDFATVNTWILNQNLVQVPYSASIAAPTMRTNLTGRVDKQLGQTNTFIGRYQWLRNRETRDGVGQSSLDSQGLTLSNTDNTLQLTDTQVLSAKGINETRFEYEHTDQEQHALSNAPEIFVSGAFIGGGNAVGNTTNTLNHFELQNYTSWLLHKHAVRFGATLRATAEQRYTTQGYNGTFIFDSLQSYQNTLLSGEGSVPVAPLTQASAPTQFSITTGQPALKNTYVQFAAYGEDDWRIRPYLTLSAGLRYQLQNEMGRLSGLAPRIGAAWALGHNATSAKTLLRVGGGLFFDSFTQPLALQMLQLNGVNQQSFIIPAPTFFPTVIDPSQNDAASQYRTIYGVNQNLRTPTTFQGALSLEQHLSQRGSVAVTYLYSRGIHQLLTRNINAPLELTPGADSGPRPQGNIGNIYQYESAGIFKQNQLTVNLTVRATNTLALFAMYALGRAESNTGGATSFPSDQYNLALDYGRAPFDIRNRIFTGANLTLRYGLQFSPLLIAHIGIPFNITTGNDWNGDGILNDRPAYATDLSRPSVVTTFIRFLRFTTNFGGEDHSRECRLCPRTDKRQPES